MSDEPLKINRPVFVRGADGKSVAAILDMASFETLIQLLEDEYDRRFMDSGAIDTSDAIPFGQAIAEIEAAKRDEYYIAPEDADDAVSLKQAQFFLLRICYASVDEDVSDNVFWSAVSKNALDKVWDDPGDDVYNELLKDRLT